MKNLKTIIYKRIHQLKTQHLYNNGIQNNEKIQIQQKIIIRNIYSYFQQNWSQIDIIFSHRLPKQIYNYQFQQMNDIRKSTYYLISAKGKIIFIPSIINYLQKVLYTVIFFIYQFYYMKIRANRTHFTGASNRFHDTFTRANSLIENHQAKDSEQKMIKTTNHLVSPGKCESSHYKRMLERSEMSFMNKSILSDKLKQPIRENPLIGQNIQLHSKRFDKTKVRGYIYKNTQLKPFNTDLVVPNELNKEVQGIKNYYQNKEINMHKLNQIKKAFITNFVDKTQMKSFFQKYAQNGKVNIGGIKKLVKDFGFYVNDDEAKIMLSLNRRRIDETNLSIQQFIDLTTKQNIFFETLKFKDIKAADIKQEKIFTKKVHLILRNAFVRLKEAMKIYQKMDIPLNQAQFKKIFKKLDLTQLVITENELNHVFNQFKNENQTLNVERLLCGIAEQQNLNILKRKNPIQTGFQDNLNRYKELTSLKKQKDLQFQLKHLSNNDYQRQLKKIKRMVTDIKKIYKKSQFQQLLKQNGDQLSRQQLRSNLQTILQKSGLNYTKMDYQALLSSFNYNNSNTSNIKQVIKNLYEQNQLEFHQRMDRKHRKLPPTIQNNTFVADYDINQINNTIKKIDEFILSDQFTSLFKKLDGDKDGYVSKQDIKSFINKKKIVAQNQLDNLISYLDSDRKGYFQYQQLHSKLHSNLSNQIKNELPALTYKKTTQKQQKWLTTKRNFINQTNKFEMKVPTKYSAWPTHLNNSDLSLIQGQKNSALYINEFDRFNNNKGQIGNLQKQRLKSIHQNKLRKLSNWQAYKQETIQNSREQEIKKFQKINYLKRLAHQIYETNCHN